MKTLHIIGSGGHARDVAEIAARCGWRPVFVAQGPEQRDAWRGADDIVLQADLPSTGEVDYAIGIGDNSVRARVSSALPPGARLPTLVDPDTSLARGISETLAASRGTVVFPGVRIMGGCSIGDFCTLNVGTTLSHDCRIGDFANLSPGAHIAGNVTIGEGAWIGMGVVINQGTDAAPRRIGDWATIGSGAAVLRDVPDGATWVGVPAREQRP